MSDKVLLKPPGKKLPEPPSKSSIIMGVVNHKYFEKFLTFLGILLTIYIASALFTNAEFLIKPYPKNGVELTIWYNDSPRVDPSILYGNLDNIEHYNPRMKVRDNITIKAENCYRFKPYNSPIYLNYSFIYENGTRRDVKEIGVRASRRLIETGNYSILTIFLKEDPIETEYLLRVWGRGGGESIIFDEGPFQSPKVIVSGIEPIHHCTITITIDRIKRPPDIETVETL